MLFDAASKRTWNERVGAAMRAIALASLSLIFSTSTFAGNIDEQFAATVGGIAWGTKLDELVGVRPGGDHFFSTAPGDRGYRVPDDEPLFGIPRQDMKVQYHFGKNNEVIAIAYGLPYERREQLLGQLLLLFGPYRKPYVEETSLNYDWPADRRVAIAVRASREPKNGILEFWLHLVPTRNR